MADELFRGRPERYKILHALKDNPLPGQSYEAGLRYPAIGALSLHKSGRYDYLGSL
jgi:hypothetical protein